MSAISSTVLRYNWLSTYRLAATIVPHDYSQWRVEFDDLNMLVVERSDTSNGELVKRRPVMSVTA